MKAELLAGRVRESLIFNWLADRVLKDFRGKYMLSANHSATGRVLLGIDFGELDENAECIDRMTALSLL